MRFPAKLRKAAMGSSWALRHPSRLARLTAALATNDAAAAIATFDERASTTAGFHVMRKGGVIEVTFQRNGTTWRTDVGDSIGWSLWENGHYQAHDVEAIRRWLDRRGRSASWVVDAGANVGTTSLPFARAGYRVLAIEPVPRTFAMLEANVTANHLDDLITCSCSAIATDRGVVKMWTGFGSGQAELAIEGHRPAIDYWGDRGQLVDVAAAPLDEIVARHELDPADVALVWADIQGAEAELIVTAESLWAAGVPLYLEVYPAGLELHGGLPNFTSAVTSRFATFRAKGSDEDVPISRFEEWVAGIDPDWYTDALLIP